MDIKAFDHKIYLASPKMHGEELEYIHDAFEKNLITTAGDNINELEEFAAEYIGINNAVALSSGTASLHLACKLAGLKINPGAKPSYALEGQKVFTTDMTFDATVNPIVYEGGEPVFIDTEYDTWNMNPDALKKAFEIYPDCKIVMVASLYGTPAKLDEIRSIVKEHGALLIEDAAESLGATYKGRQTGAFGDYNAISFNGNKIITGSSGGMLLANEGEDADKVRKWSTQSREAAPWYQHEELGYNYRMSNIIAGIVRGQIPYLEEHIERKKAIYERYRDGLKDLPISMNPFDEENSVPNYWLSCALIDEVAMAPMVRGEQDYLWKHEPGKSSPQEILDTLLRYNTEGRPVWKPMHMQPIYRSHAFVTVNGNGRGQSNADIAGSMTDVGADIFSRGLCLPSDINMTVEEQDIIIQIIRSCFE